MRLKTSMGEKVTYSLICVFVLLYEQEKKNRKLKIKKKRKVPTS